MIIETLNIPHNFEVEVVITTGYPAVQHVNLGLFLDRTGQ
jgi:hypothetical protein